MKNEMESSQHSTGCPSRSGKEFHYIAQCDSIRKKKRSLLEAVNNENNIPLDRKHKASRSSEEEEAVKNDGNLAEEEEGDQGPPWDAALHRAFVESILELGIKHASPSIIVENMSSRPTSMTSERVKSHLQKLRMHRDKEQKKFFEDYDTFMLQALKGMKFFGPNAGAPDFLKMIEKFDKVLMGGNLAAFLTCSVMMECGGLQTQGGLQTAKFGDAQCVPATNSAGDPGVRIPRPKLDEEENDSPLGTSLAFVMGLLEHMGKFLMEQRGRRSSIGSSSSSSTEGGEDRQPSPLSQFFFEVDFPEDPFEKKVNTLHHNHSNDGLSIETTSSFSDDEHSLLFHHPFLGPGNDEKPLETAEGIARQRYAFPGVLPGPLTADPSREMDLNLPALPSAASQLLEAAFRPPPLARYFTDGLFGNRQILQAEHNLAANHQTFCNAQSFDNVHNVASMAAIRAQSQSCIGNRLTAAAMPSNTNHNQLPHMMSPFFPTRFPFLNAAIPFWRLADRFEEDEEESWMEHQS